MKTYHILKDFNGSQTGHDFKTFKANTTDQISDALAAIAVKEGWAKSVDDPAQFAVTVTELPVAVSDAAAQALAEGRFFSSEDRETKVVEPAETKPEKPKKHKK